MKKQLLCEKGRKLLLRYGLYSLDLQHALCLVFDQGEYLFREGDSVGYIYFVISGKAKVFLHLSDGKQLLLAYFLSEGIIGDVELVTGTRTAFSTVQAGTEFLCAALPLDFYAVELKSNNSFMNCIARDLAIKLMQRCVNGTITTLQPLEARLCAYITQAAAGRIFRETLTEVAVVVGASYRHLLRCMDKLCKDGVLRKEPSGYIIINQHLLSQKAGDSYLLKQNP